MATMANIEITKINIDLLTVGEVKKGKGLSAPLMYDGQRCSILLPKMSYPGGLLSRADEQTGVVSHSLIGSLKGCPSDGKARCEGDEPLSRTYNTLQDIGTLVKRWAFENSAKLFGKKRSQESIDDSFNERSIMSISSDKVGGEYVPNGKYPPSFKAKIPVYDGRLVNDFQIVDQKNKDIPVTVQSLASIFPKGVSANLLVTGSIYIIGQSFGISWKVSMAQVFAPTRLTASSVFESVADEDSVEVAEATEAPEAEAEAEAESETVTAAAPVPQRKRRAALPV
jgi:hypothetical protein